MKCRLLYLLTVAGIAIATTLEADSTFSDADWTGMGLAGGGVTIDSFRPGTIRAIAVDSNGDLYVGGAFSFAGGVRTNNIAKWDGNRWSALGEGIGGGVRALAIDASGHRTPDLV
ncbi:MAG: hypothetical protein K9N23_00930 [Akkermansiaceae bacterium]|nr:hypothetical protein [Akkermansiaceae bacterium]